MEWESHWYLNGPFPLEELIRMKEISCQYYKSDQQAGIWVSVALDKLFPPPHTANNVVDTNSVIISHPPPPLSPLLFSSLSSIFLIENKTYHVKAQNKWWPMFRPLSRPRGPFWSPLAAILDFAGGAALQAVTSTPGPAPLGWYFSKLSLALALAQLSRLS